jgi:uncharacterized protein (TIGR02266 family)
MSTKTVLVAHRAGHVRDRFAAALADAHHRYVLAGTAPAALQAAAAEHGISLALVDLGLQEDGVALVRALRRPHAVPVVVFSGSIASAAVLPQLAQSGVVGYVNDHAATPQILPALAPHLFPDSFNRRTSVRVALGVPVSYRTGRSPVGAVTLNVAKGGIAIRTMNPATRGAPIHVKFRLPGVVTEIEASGHVAWSDGKVGMGVQFDRISAAHQAVLDAFVDEHR